MSADPRCTEFHDHEYPWSLWHTKVFVIMENMPAIHERKKSVRIAANREFLRAKPTRQFTIEVTVNL
jgi:hypothetical protein